MAEIPNIVSANENYIPNFTLPYELINGAVDTEIGPTCQKLVHPDFPGLLIRHLHPVRISSLNKQHPDRLELRTKKTFIDILRQRYRDNYGELSSHGIEVTPFSILQDQDGEINIVAQKVVGLPLQEALAGKIPGAMESLDSVMCGNINYLRAARQRDGEYLYDTVGVAQYMFGHYDGETTAEDRVIFVDVDVDDTALWPVTELHNDRILLDYLVTLTYDILKAEALTGLGGLQASRQMVREELENVVNSGQDKWASKKAGDILTAFDANDLEEITAYEMA